MRATVVVCVHDAKHSIDATVYETMAAAHNGMVRELLSHLKYFSDEEFKKRFLAAVEGTRHEEDRSRVFEVWKEWNIEDSIQFFEREVLRE